MKNAYVSSYVITFLELEVAKTLSGNIRSPWFFDLHSVHYRSVYKLILIELLQFLPNLNHMVSHGLTLLATDLMAYISKATGTGTSNIDFLFADVM